MRFLFNDNWYFIEQPLRQDEFVVEEALKKMEVSQHVAVPHDWLITDTHSLYRDSEGWYLKTFEISASELNKRHFIEFDGVYQEVDVYFNKVLLGSWKNGYTSFEFELTDELRLGNNQLFVRVRHQAPNSRWYSGAGIYRNIWFRTVDQVYIKRNSLYTHSEKVNIESGAWQVETHLSLMNPKGTSSEVKIEQRIFDEHNKLVVAEVSEYKIKPNIGEEVVYVNFVILDPKLWSPEVPNMYRLEVTISGTDFTDTCSVPLGFKEIHLDPNRGLILNGAPLKIQGVCQHHDLGALGSAINQKAIKRQLVKLKEMGVNAIRTAHNLAAPELLSLADELGFLIQSELTDVWKHSKTTYDYARFFEDWVEKDVESWITSERNHPSIFMWSIGNEIYDTHGREDGLETTQMLINLVKKYDYMENAVVTFGSNYLLWEGTQKAADLMKVVGYNYGENLYETQHEAFPEWVIYGSETCSVVHSRGIYHFPLAQSILADDDRQCSSLGNSTTSWGAKSVESCIIRDRDIPYSLGQFIWTGFDYIGEPTPYNTKNSYFGQIDTAGFAKDSFYMFQAAWVSYKVKPMIHLFPYWDFSSQQLIDVRVCSNAPKIELFYNGKSLGGVRDNDVKNGDKLLHDWSIPYEKGKLVAVGYDLNGNQIAKDTIQSFGDTAELKLSTTDTLVGANGEDLIFVEIEAVDSKGNLVANANNRVHIEIVGEGRLIGIDNGDSTDYDQYKENSKRLFSGKLLAIIAPTFQAGPIEIKVKSKGLPVAKKVVESTEVIVQRGVSKALVQSTPSTILEELPVRKIEIINQAEKKVLNSTADKLRLEARIYPEIADYKELEWRVTDSKGIDSSLANYEVDTEGITILPIADGDIYIRCGTKNGNEYLDLYSLTDLKIAGIKQASLNPYEPISGGLYTRSNKQLTNGNERGVATLRGETSWVIFDDVDFGSSGSANLTMALFPLEDNEFPIEIWSGSPNEASSELIETVIYNKGTIWNTYQTQTYELSQKFIGKQTISLVFKQKVHIRDFYFKKENRAFKCLNILENDLMYGDSFVVREMAVENIGNNVTFQFDDMNFGGNGVSKIRVHGQTPLNQNSIQIKFSSEKSEERRILEFSKSDDYEWQEFEFDLITGQQKVEFIFLPGSHFNFSEFQFIEAK